MLNVRQGHIGLDLSSRPVTQCASPLLANDLMLRTRHLPITVSACAARLVRALSHTIVGNIDCDQTRLLLIVERGVERLYRGPHGIERRHESSQSLLECILANSSARQPPGCSHESTGPLSERNRRLGWGAS